MNTRVLITAALICMSWWATWQPMAPAAERAGQVASAATGGDETPLAKDFATPPDSARPWVYWFIMDGNLTREGITADLEAMQRAGIGGAIILEVDIGIPRGPVEFMSAPWRELLKHALCEADRLGLAIALGAGPGWCGTGGPWVKAEQSMQHLVASETAVAGPAKFDAVLPRPRPRTPFFGEATLTPELARQWREFFRDVAVVAFPTPRGDRRIADVDEKALYYRNAFSSQPGVKPFLTAAAGDRPPPADQCIPSPAIVDLTARLGPGGRLAWDVPPGQWTILRFARTATGQITRPAPAAGLGFESDKFDKSAIDRHFAAFIETLLRTVGEPKHPRRGLTALHFDSWEMSSQNWSGDFRRQFAARRGYDLLRYLPVMTGRVVDSEDLSERFLWDLRQTAQELVVENHILRLKQLGRRHGLELSIEPYDLNPCADLKLGGPADVPMCEFWSTGYGFPTEFSCFEAVSIAHTLGRRVIGAEAFTAFPEEQWRQYPGSMKPQGDWALATGINRFVFHRYQHQPRLDQWPGMTMGPYGVHWERTQTWWDMVGAYHLYLARCQQMLRRGLPVADILYLAPEGAPQVFRAPRSATQGTPPDRRGYNFDGCDPDALLDRAGVKNGRIVLSDAMSYRLLVLPRFDSMTPRLLRKIRDLVKAGATVIGAPPGRSPSLAGYPQCDHEVRQLAAEIWGGGKPPAERRLGSGRVIYDAGMRQSAPANPLARAKWIWYPEGHPAASAPVGKRYFRRTVRTYEARMIESAEVTMTADNRFELSVNGCPVGNGEDFHVAHSIDVTPWLKPGTNVLAVTGVNGGEQPNPAGLIGSLAIHFVDGGATVVNTDDGWISALAADGPWKAAAELGPVGMPPWNLGDPPAWTRDLYPDYSTTARVLSGMGVPPDFQSDGQLRYSHRRERGADLYFIANRLDQVQTTICRFRTHGRAPEWWDPVSGQCRELPEYDRRQALTAVPLRLEPFESGFVVFRKPAAKASPSRSGKNFPDIKPIDTLSGPWQVAFDPKWGGPAKITMFRLTDWRKRSEPGIRYYSGKAVYRTSFDADDATVTGSGVRLCLSLGRVKNLASVKLNGKELGVVWCAPWRVEIPPGVLRPRQNDLEITVANLWINRLIGDSGLPAAKRLAATTWNPFTPASPLVESGLLGPVTLCVGER
jgi:hypothetical protein